MSETGLLGWVKGLLLLVMLQTGCKINPDKKADNPLQSEDNSRPMVFWYWNQAAVSKEGITCDLEAMRDAGFEGAYLFFIRGNSNPPIFEPAAIQLSPGWWELVAFAFKEAKRLGLHFGLHSCDGFTVAGGPWITPEMSMQKIVWSDTIISGGKIFDGKIRQPETIRNYYKDIRYYAYPLSEFEYYSSYSATPEITSNIPEINPFFLNNPESTERFRSEKPCYVQYKFNKPFTCRNILIRKAGGIFQAQRLILETSNDGIQFSFHTRLVPHRQGWQDSESDATFSIPPVTARYFRFHYDPEGTEPGAEDLDAAKWKQVLKIAGIELSSIPAIHQFEGKSGLVWRISEHTNSTQLPDSLCIPKEKLFDLNSFTDTKGHINWQVPPGKWRIIRLGATTTGKTNYIGGGAVGLECDKLNPAAVKFQFDHWINEFYSKIGEPELEGVLRYFHVDSWECGSQNWSPVLLNEFKKRRGYDLMPFLPVFAGIPIQNSKFSENLLFDIRKTISELVADNFYGTMKKLSSVKHLVFSAESNSPVMTTDGLSYFQKTDFPMGEFWLNSPTHDKPNDILDAVSAGHLYGKKIIQAEAFTELRIDWNEHPAMLKLLADRNFAIGINKLAFHVFSHNPWVDRKPGMTLGATGTFFQPGQTWFKQSKSFVGYVKNCQEQLQKGIPVTDIAVFTGEEIPQRSFLPERLISLVPGVFNPEILRKEKIRLQNLGVPFHEKPDGVTCIRNISNPADWVDPLQGYAYDSFNADALLRLAKVENNQIRLPGGASYKLLVIPQKHKMSPNGNLMSLPVIKKIEKLILGGAYVLFVDTNALISNSSLEFNTEKIRIFKRMFGEPFDNLENSNLKIKNYGKGKIIIGEYDLPDFKIINCEKAIEIKDFSGKTLNCFAWNHRKTSENNIYFIANQTQQRMDVNLSFRVIDKQPSIYYPVSGLNSSSPFCKSENKRTIIPMRFEPGESVFVLFDQKKDSKTAPLSKNYSDFDTLQILTEKWELLFDPKLGGPNQPIVLSTLVDLSKNMDSQVKYYSGTVKYKTLFSWNSETNTQNIYLQPGSFYNVCEVILNGINCGTLWTPPYRVEITKALKTGINQLEIEVTNTWSNRLKGDLDLPEKKKVLWSTAPDRVKNKSLLPSGLIGPVSIVAQIK